MMRPATPPTWLGYVCLAGPNSEAHIVFLTNSSAQNHSPLSHFLLTSSLDFEGGPYLLGHSSDPLLGPSQPQFHSLCLPDLQWPEKCLVD